MSKITLITDTNASLPKAIIDKYQIIEVPILIEFEGETYTTGVTINDQKLFEMVDAHHVLPTTAAPSPSAFTKAFQQALDEGATQVICVCCSSEVSGTYNAAQVGAQAFPDSVITVVDSKNLTLAEGFQVLAAAEAIEAGKNKEAVLDVINQVWEHTHVFGALPTLKYLAMGGRIGRLAAGFGNTLDIKPILTSQEGKLDMLEKVRTWRKAKQRLIELGTACSEGKEILRVGLMHVNNESGVMELFAQLQQSLNIDVEPIVTEFTPGLSVHTGSGVIAFVMITS